MEVRARLRTLWWCRWPAAAATLVVAGAFHSQPALQDAATLAATPFQRTMGLAYLAGAPLFGLWDSLTIVAASQHAAVVATFVAWHLFFRLGVRWRRRRSSPSRAATDADGGDFAARRQRTRLRLAGAETLRAVAALLLLLGFYAGGAALPRPMTGIDLGDPDLVSVDFHSHTRRSHDGRKSFTAARNRAWHEAGGFDAAYVTDHDTWDGVDEALRANPARAGDRTVLLSGAELRLRDRHTNVLGDPSRYVFALDDRRHLDGDSLAAAYRRGARPPTMLYAIPAPLDRIEAFSPEFPAGVVGIELNDGAPRGLEQSRKQRDDILALADSLNLAVVAGANLHGWGRTAAAWSVMRIPAWRDMTPDALGAAVEVVLHRDRRNAVTVVERRMPYHDGAFVRLVATVPWLLWEHFRMLHPMERVSWLAWAGLWAALARMRGARRAARNSCRSEGAQPALG